MYTIDRSIAIIRPKLPFLDWANQLPDAEDAVSLDDLKKDCTVVLIAECNGDEEASECISEMCLDFFEGELFSWCTHEPWWPQNRTKEMFWELFEVEFHSMVIDPYEDRVIRKSL
jgi:hypothetical protein